MGKYHDLAKKISATSAYVQRMCDGDLAHDANTIAQNKELGAMLEIALRFDEQDKAQQAEIERLRAELRLYKNQLAQVVNDREKLMARIAELDRLTTGWIQGEREKTAPEPVYYDLKPGEIIMEGDEFYAGCGIWTKTFSPGSETEIGGPVYRRKVQPEAEAVDVGKLYVSLKPGDVLQPGDQWASWNNATMFGVALSDCDFINDLWRRKVSNA